MSVPPVPTERVPGRLYLLEGDEWLPFDPPLRCMCCGQEISVEQWRFSCLCGSCDVGACQYNNRSYRVEYAHTKPNWMRAGASRMEVHRLYSQAHVEARDGGKVAAP